MNWSLQSNSRFPTRFLAYVTVAALFFVVLDSVAGGALREKARDVLIVPAYWGEQIISGIQGIPFIASGVAYRNEFRALQEEVGALRERQTLFSATADENASLQQLLKLRTDEGAVAASVISSVSARQFGTLLLDAGRARGVHEGALVLSENGYAIGEIESVGETSARVTLYFAPHATIEVTAKSAQFTLDGRGGGNARAQVPRELPLSVREVLYAPRALSRPVGVIGHLSSASSSAFTDIYAFLPVQLETLRFVLIVPRDQKPQ